LFAFFWFLVSQVFASHLLVEFHGRRTLSLRLATSGFEKAADTAFEAFSRAIGSSRRTDT
jgi:hypothetical protein